jgi:hypothetical protein
MPLVTNEINFANKTLFPYFKIHKTGRKSKIHFSLQNKQTRLKLWQNYRLQYKLLFSNFL